jgi:hypothetical protein
MWLLSPIAHDKSFVFQVRQAVLAILDGQRRGLRPIGGASPAHGIARHGTIACNLSDGIAGYFMLRRRRNIGSGTASHLPTTDAINGGRGATLLAGAANHTEQSRDFVFGIAL